MLGGCELLLLLLLLEEGLSVESLALLESESGGGWGGTVRLVDGGGLGWREGGHERRSMEWETRTSGR